MDVDWRFISLRIVNKDRDYEKEFRPATSAATRAAWSCCGWRPRCATSSGATPCCRCTRRSARVIHHEQGASVVRRPRRRPGRARGAGLPAWRWARRPLHRARRLIAAETQEALDRCGGNIGTPVLSFTPPDGPSFFGPVINKAPKGQEAVDLWDAVVALGSNPHFSELKRTSRPAAVRLTAQPVTRAARSAR